MDSTEPQNNLDAVGSSETIVADNVPRDQVEPETQAASEDPEQHASKIENLPAVKNWKTSILFSILGYVLGKLFLGTALVVVMMLPAEFFLASTGGSTSSTAVSQFIRIPLVIILLILELLYAIGFYRSYFTKSPWLKSSKAISFCNLMFGGIIFGCLWNHNLTLSQQTQSRMMGISYKVFSAFTILARGFVILNTLVIMPYFANTYSQQPHMDNSSKPASSTLSDPASGVSATIPSGWKKVGSGKDYPDNVKWVLVPTDSSIQAQIAFITWDIYAAAPEEQRNRISRSDINTRHFDEEYILSTTRGSLTNIEYEKADLLELGGNEYWVAGVIGTTPPKETNSGKSQVDTRVNCYHYDNGIAYLFSLDVLGGSKQTDEKLVSDLENMVASTVYK